MRVSNNHSRMSTAEPTTPTSRQARRRRIVSQGSDRFALITGRIQSLPPPPPPPPDQSLDATCPPSISQDHLQLPPDLHSFDSINREDEGSTPLSHNDPISELNTESVGPVMPESVTGEEASKVPLLNSDIREQPSQWASTSLDTHDSSPEHHVEPITRHFDFFRPKDISSAVTSTEWTRIYCALAAAIIVVLSYVGSPMPGSYIIRGVILFRPLYLLILTNISIVAQHVLFEQQRGSARAGQREGDIPPGSGLNQFGDVLEIGLLMQKAMGSLFMDCSIFSVVVVCGLSIANTLGW